MYGIFRLHVHQTIITQRGGSSTALQYYLFDGLIKQILAGKFFKLVDRGLARITTSLLFLDTLSMVNIVA